MLNILKPALRASLSQQHLKTIRYYAGPAGGGPPLAKKSFGVSAKMLRLQKHFQKKNDVPVFLKGIKNDVILYYTTLGSAGLGLIMNFAFYVGYIVD
uniref:Uncharacterized protein n=1 Tax=Glossina palpalis gambiensis TaxID=67801 RepID=A0A1B0B113_9MUSC